MTHHTITCPRTRTAVAHCLRHVRVLIRRYQAEAAQANMDGSPWAANFAARTVGEYRAILSGHREMLAMLHP